MLSPVIQSTPSRLLVSNVLRSRLLPGANLTEAKPGNIQTTLFPSFQPLSTGEIALARRCRENLASWSPTAEDAYLFKGAVLAGPHGIPRLEPNCLRPLSLVSYSEIDNIIDLTGCVIHFFECESRGRAYKDGPHKLLKKLKGAMAKNALGVIGLDLSTNADISSWRLIENTRWNYAVSSWLQRNGIPVISSLRIPGRWSIPYSISGTPEVGTIALSLHGCIKPIAERGAVVESIQYATQVFGHCLWLAYGSDGYGVLDYPRECGVEILTYPSDCYRRSEWRLASLV